MKKLNLNPGHKFGDWEVLSINGKDVKVKCICGFEKTTSIISNMINGSSKKCVNCANKAKWGDYLNLPVPFFNKIKKHATKREIDFTVSKQYVESILISQDFKCALTGLLITLPTNPKELVKYTFTGSLDRIDSLLPYQEGNIQWVHKHINLMKNILKQDYFIQMCKLVSNNN